MTYKRLNDIINEAVNRIVADAEAKEKKNTLTEAEKNKIVNVLTEAKKKSKEDEKKSEEKTTREKKDTSKKLSEKKLKVMRHQVVTMLNQDKIKMAAIGRIVYPEMDEDEMRSLISRYANGEEEIPDERVPSFYNALRSDTRGRKGKTF